MCVAEVVEKDFLAEERGIGDPEGTVKTTLTFGTNVPAHGDAKMPVWGALFDSLDSGSGPSSVPKLRIHNLTEYIKTLQAK